MEFAETLRAEVLQATDCIVSCGIGNSILIARLATRKAKPDGVFQVKNEEISNFIGKNTHQCFHTVLYLLEI